MDNPVISVDRLTKYYGRTVGVKNVSFAVERGEIFGFLGPNGAGKTTTIRLLLGLIRATSGAISVLGRPVPAGSLASRKRCGYLPGDFEGYAHLTAAEFLRFAAELRGAEAPAQQELLERFRFSQADLGRKIKHLSHGTRQKLGIVQAFFHRPELAILDEPTSGLDPLMQEAFYELLRRAQDDGCTVFFSSHVLPEVEKTCQRVAIIREGEVVALETLDALKQRRFRRLSVTYRAPVGRVELPGATLVKQEGKLAEYLVEGEIGPLLQALSGLPVADIVFPEADLEEVFMAYYRRSERA